MKEICFFLALTVLMGCRSNVYKSNYFFHKDITESNFHHLLDSKNLKTKDTIWLTDKTVCIQAGKHLEVGSIVNGKKRGKWYHYYILKDTVDCYYIEKFTNKDSTFIYGKAVNRANW